MMWSRRTRLRHHHPPPPTPHRRPPANPPVPPPAATVPPPPTVVCNVSPGLPATRAVTAAPGPPADGLPLELLPPCPPSAAIVTEQIPDGTGSVVATPGVAEENSVTGAAAAGPAATTNVPAPISARATVGARDLRTARRLASRAGEEVR